MLPPILLLAALIFVIITALVGLARGFKRFLPSLIVMVVCVAAAFVATLILKGIIGDALSVVVYDLLDQLLGQGTFESIAQSMPTAAGFIDALPSALLAPFIFVVCFAVILFVAEIIRVIVTAIIRKAGKKSDGKTSDDAETKANLKKAKRNNRLLGLGAGALGGLVLAFAFLLPLIGYVGMLSEAVDDLNEASPEVMEEILADEEAKDVYVNYIEPILNDPYVKVSYMLGGKMVFDGVASVDVQGNNYPLAKLVSTGCSVYGHIIPFMNAAPPDYGEGQIDAVNNIMKDLEGDVLLTNICAEFISGLATAWENDEAFLGISPIKEETYFSPVLDKLFATFATTNDENVVSDLRVVADIMTTLIRYDAIAVFSEEGGDIQDVLATPGFVSELCASIQKNERMQPIFFEVAKMGVVLVSDVVGIPGDPDEIYNRFLNDLATETSQALPEYRESNDSVFFEKTLKEIFEKNGMKLSADAISSISKALLEKMAGKPSVNSADVRKFFSEDILSSVDAADAYYTEIKTLSTDIAAGKLTSSLATLEEIVDQMNETSPSNAESESQKFESVVTSAILVKDSLDGEEKNILFAIDSQSIEDIVVNLSLTETFGGAVNLLLKGICQSSMLVGTGFSGDSIYDDIIAGGYDNIANTLETVKHAVKMFEILSAPKNDSDDGSGGTANITENIQWIVSNMTPATSAIISSQINEETLKNYGVSEESAAPVADLMSNMFDSMANENGLSEEEYKTESDAINHLFTVATELSSADMSDSVFDNEVSSATDITETVLNSKVVSEALVNTAYDENGTLKENPLAVNAQLNENDKATMVEALNNYASNNLSEAEDPAKEIQKISALAAVFNLNIEIAEDGTITQKAQ